MVDSFKPYPILALSAYKRLLKGRKVFAKSLLKSCHFTPILKTMESIEAFYKISYGLYIVSSISQGKKGAYVANTVFQVTAEPPQFAISCSKNNASMELIRNSKLFAVSVLEQNTAMDLLGTFGYKSSREVDKFEGVDYIYGPLGCPIVIQHAVAWFECEVKNEVDMGTHVLFVGEIIHNELLLPEKAPLTYAFYRDEKKGLAPKNAPTYIEKSKKDLPPPGTAGAKYKCVICGYVYDPELGDEDSGIPPGTAFEDLPDDWLCPLCGAEKSDFEPMDD